MRNSLITLKALCHILPAFILSCFLSCKEDHAQNLRSRTSFPEIKEIKVNQGQIFLTFLDSLVKLSDTAFNEAGIKSVNKKYVNQLPLVMYDPIREENRQDIIMQYYKNNETSSEVESGIVILIPPKITDSLVIADFTHYFGDLTDEKPLIGITEQPLPVRIKISSDREIKLTFKINANRDGAGVTRVEILNYR